MIRVRAIAPGFYGMYRRPGEKTREGVRLDEFDIADESEFGTWMERVEPPPPAKAEAAPSQATAIAPSTTLDDVLKAVGTFGTDMRPDELTPSGFVKKAVIEKRMGRAVPQGVYLGFMKHIAETRKQAN